MGCHWILHYMCHLPNSVLLNYMRIDERTEVHYYVRYGKGGQVLERINTWYTVYCVVYHVFIH